MNKICSFAITFLLLLPSLVFAKYMAVLETLSPKDLLTMQERLYLTDIFRGQAVNILPAEQNWTIMTRENINVMLPPGKSIEDCEGSCLAETGKNIAADYVAQARISQFGKSLAITAELYETASGKLVASFVGKGESVDDIEKIIKEQSPAFFRKVRDNAMSAFGYVNTNNSFSFQATQKFIVEIQTNPEGAIPTFDGRANPQCTSTPCKLQLEAGEHRIVISKERFDDLDTIINVSDKEQIIKLNLVSNVGFIEIVPQISDEFMNKFPVVAFINEKKASSEKNEVVPGLYSVRVTHGCYDPIELNIMIQKGETVTLSDSLKRGIGGLELDITKDGVPQALPIFIDGNLAGSTPFAGEVPLCSRIEIENEGSRIEIPVNIKWHEIVKKTYELKELQPFVAEQIKDTLQQVAPDSTVQENQIVYPDSVKKDTLAPEKNYPKRFWGGATVGLLYNDFHSSKLGLDNIKHGENYSLAVSGAEDLLKNYWGVGFKIGMSGMFIQSQRFNLRGDLNLSLRKGKGKTNPSVTLSWNNSERTEKSDLEIEYSSTQLNIDLPILARIVIPNNIYFEAGPMLSFNGYSKNEVKITDIYGTQIYTENGGLSAAEFDLIIGGGVTRNIGKSILDFDLRFVLGLTRISNSKSSPKTLQVQLNATYWFL